MTIQLKSSAFAKSKATLEAALNDQSPVWFEDPSIFPGSRGYFGKPEIKPGESFPIVMDPATRMRFSTITRKPDGTFKVK